MSDGTSDLPLAVQYMVLLTMAETREDVEGIAEDAMTNDRLDQFQKDGLEKRTSRRNSGTCLTAPCTGRMHDDDRGRARLF